MAKQVVGLKLGASRLTAARLAVNGSVELVQLAEAPLPRGVIAGGEVRDVPALAEALKVFFKKNKLPKKNVRVGVANNRIGVRTLEIPGIADPKQLANAVRFRAQEALPIPINEAVLDFHILSETPGEGENEPPTRRILLVVAYRDLVNGYVEACRLAGLRLAGVDLEAFALLRALTPAVPQTSSVERSALVAVSVGADRSVLAVSDGFTCEFTRVLDWGGNSLSIAVGRALELDIDDAERVKIGLALQGDSVPEGLTPEQAVLGRDALRLALQGFGRELVSSLQFYQGQPDSLGIREVVLAGGTAQLQGLATELQKLVGVPVRVGDPLVGLAVGKRLKGGDPNPSHTVPIGLGMAV